MNGLKGTVAFVYDADGWASRIAAKITKSRFSKAVVVVADNPILVLESTIWGPRVVSIRKYIRKGGDFVAYYPVAEEDRIALEVCRVISTVRFRENRGLSPMVRRAWKATVNPGRRGLVASEMACRYVRSFDGDIFPSWVNEKRGLSPSDLLLYVVGGGKRWKFIADFKRIVSMREALS